MNDKFMKHCLHTFSGYALNPICPCLEDINKEDIAHALSLMCRSNGQISHFYSVAQHSLNCANEAIARKLSSRVVLACLLHDASEAYIADIVRPIKHNLPNYLEIESVLQAAIYDKFKIFTLSAQESEFVSDIDDCILRYEFLHLKQLDLMNNSSELLSIPTLDLQDFKSVEQSFLDMLIALQDEV